MWGRYQGAPYAYAKRIGYDEFEQRVHVALGNGAVSDYAYDPKTRRLANLATQSLGQRFQNLTYRYDRTGNVTDLVNDVAVTADGLGGWVKQHFAYDNLARLTTASGLYQGAADWREEYSLVMAYDGIHNITRKHQVHRVVGLSGAGTKQATSYDWAYRYEGAKPHAPAHIGARTFRYDLNGNQTGWTHDRNATRRAITWDDADRIQAIEDRGGEYSAYGYDDAGNRVIKQARQNLTVYVNPTFTERNGAIGSKHIFVGNTRMLTKVTGGTNFIRSYEGVTDAKTPPGQGAEKANKGKGADKGNHGRHFGQAKDHTDQGKHLGQAKNAEKGQGNRGKNVDRPNNGKADDGKAATTPTLGAHPGQGLAHRAERANEVAQNTCQNKHLAPLYCPDAGGGDTPPEDGTDPGEETPGTPPAQELIKVSMGEQLFYYHPDHLGSTGYVTRENGKLHEHLQYFPFGETWVSQGGNTEKSPYLFTAKELDEETGLYYYGARYYDPRTSVWQSPDPILGKYLDGKINGGVYNPPSLGLYSYVAQSPLRFIDPNGLWGEDVHLTKTTKWAEAVGFTPKQAERIGRADNGVDSVWGGKSFLPKLLGGDQSYHFNTNTSGTDSRMERHKEHFDKAVDLGKRARTWRALFGDHPAVVALENAGLDELGKSLHPLQDVDAHTPQFTQEKLGAKYHESPELFNSGPNLADDSGGNEPGSNGKARLAITQQKTEDALRAYQQAVNQP